ncbi:MAG: hypothetical protein IJN82_05175 [Clostridia bacterium]|nr:hypothetical protein [Clostridia bacterium]
MKRIISALTCLALLLSLVAGFCLPAIAAEAALSGFSAADTAASAGFVNLYDKAAARTGTCAADRTVTPSAWLRTSAELAANAGETVYFGPSDPLQAEHLYFWNASGAYTAIGADALTLEGTFDNGQALYSYTFSEAGTFCTVNEAAYNEVFVVTKKKVTVQGILNAMTAAGGNLYDRALGRYEGYVDSANGTAFKSNVNHNSTYAIAVTPGETVTFGPALIGQSFHGSCFDVNMKLVSGLHAINDTTAGFKPVATLDSASAIYSYTVPEGVSYLRLVNRTPYRNHFFVTKGAVSSVADFYALQGKDPASPLFGKTALYVGDSITKGFSDPLIYFYGATTSPQYVARGTWGGRLAERFDMTYTNLGTSGTAVSTVKGADQQILNQLKKAAGKTYDYVIIHGGVNDAWKDAPLGSFDPDSYDPSKFDTSTFAGGLEELFYTAAMQFGDTAAIGYIVNFLSPSHSATADSAAYFALAKQICDKWNVEYLDLTTEEITNKMAMTTIAHTYDYIHPNREGYDLLLPYIADWMETLTPYDGDAIWQANVELMLNDAEKVEAKWFTAESFASFEAAIDAVSGSAIEQYTALLNAAKQLVPANGLPLSLEGTNFFYDYFATFTVSTAEELNAFATLSKTKSYEGITIALADDLDLTGGAFEMIGSASVPFKGIFDGQNHTVSGLSLTGSNQGFFAQITDGEVKNLTLSGATLSNSGASGILAAKLSGTTAITNVHIKNSTITAGNNANGGFAGAVVNGGKYTLSYCTVDNLTVDGFTNLKQQTAGFIAGSAYNVTLDHCSITNSTVSAHRNGGLLVSYGNNTTVKNLIAYGNTLKGNYSSIGLIGGQLQNTTVLENCVFYPTDGVHNVSGGDTAADKNAGEFYLFGYQKLNVSVTAENVYTCETSDTSTTATVLSTNEAELASGAIAYNLGWAMKNGKIAFADAQTPATKKYTYITDGEEAVRYTDSTGNIIGDEVVLPDGSEWDVTEHENGDKTFRVKETYDPNGTYPITDFERYPLATKFSVSTAAEFKAFADLVVAQKIGSNITVLQTADIDLSGYPNVQVGNTRGADYAFAATYDGQGHTLSGYTLNAPTVYYVGLFMGLRGTVKNLVIDGANVTGRSHSAILVGESYGTDALIQNVQIKNSTLSVKERRAAFMLYGLNTGYFRVENCKIFDCTMNTGTVAGNPIGLVATKAESGPCAVTNTYVYGNTINVQAATTSFGELIGDGRGVIITNCGTFGNTYKGTAIGSRHGFVAATNTGAATVTKIENSYTDVATLANVATTGGNNFSAVTVTELADGSLAYRLKGATKMDWVQSAYPQLTSGKAVTKYTYLADGAEYAVRYTDASGKMIGEVSEPEKADYRFDGWQETAEGEDKIYTARFTALPKVDLNNDGTTDSSDIIVLLNHMNGDKVVDSAVADVNGDGKISLADALRLMKLLAQ